MNKPVVQTTLSSLRLTLLENDTNLRSLQTDFLLENEKNLMSESTFDKFVLSFDDTELFIIMCTALPF